MTKKILRPILISIIQVIGLAIIHYLAYYLFPMHHKSVGFGLTIITTGIILSISLLAFNFYLEFKNSWIYIVGLILLIITSISPIMAIDYRPIRALFLILLSLGGFISSIVISRWKIKNKLDSKSKFRSTIKNYYNDLAEGKIPNELLRELIDRITETQYNDYKRFWKQYPKSRKRYSRLKIEDLEHPFTQYILTDFFKVTDFENYKRYSMILLKMTEKEFSDYETRKYQNETK